MEKLLEHVFIAITLAGLITAGIQKVKKGLVYFDINPSGKQWFVISFLTSVAIAAAYTGYYNNLTLIESVLVYGITIFGPQGFYDVLISNGGSGDEDVA